MRSLMLAVMCCGCAAETAPPDRPGKVTIGRVEWHTDYDAAMKEARRADKPLWLHFGEHPG